MKDSKSISDFENRAMVVVNQMKRYRKKMQDFCVVEEDYSSLVNRKTSLYGLWNWRVKRLRHIDSGPIDGFTSSIWKKGSKEEMMSL